jgi:polar amino acid transport system substrate-binding protein
MTRRWFGSTLTPLFLASLITSWGITQTLGASLCFSQTSAERTSPETASTPLTTEIQPALRWSADAKSGVPYMFVDPQDPAKMQGFELDIMTELAQKMGRKLVFVQNEWESLVPGLDRGDYDVAANGIEITPEREEQVLFSLPYYATFEQIVVHADNEQIRDLQDLSGKKTGTLKASLAHYILERETQAKIVFYDEEDQGYTDVANRRIDSFFVDYPIALYYAFPNKKLKAVGPPIGKMLYGIAVSKKRPELIPELNRGIKLMNESGSLEKIYAKWNLLHPFTIRELGLKTSEQNNTAELDKVAQIKNQTLSFRERMVRYASLMPLLLKGALTSIQISVISMFAAIGFGLILALMRLYGKGAVSLIGQSIVEFIRGTPLLIQLYLIFFGLPYLGVNLTPFWAAILGLGLNYGAYEAENYRAGIEAIPKSQLEAAQALALSPFQRFAHVVFPQAYRIILPPMTNDFISLIKDSSLVSVITMVELTTIYSQLASTYFDHLGLGILVAIIYFAIGYPFVRLARQLEKNLKKKA